jgi:hypothetical protein
MKPVAPVTSTRLVLASNKQRRYWIYDGYRISWNVPSIMDPTSEGGLAASSALAAKSAMII